MDEVTGGWRKWHILKRVLLRTPIFMFCIYIKNCVISNPCHILLGHSNEGECDERGVGEKRNAHTGLIGKP